MRKREASLQTENADDTPDEMVNSAARISSRKCLCAFYRSEKALRNDCPVFVSHLSLRGRMQ
jgi:hypothetical protein